MLPVVVLEIRPWGTDFEPSVQRFMLDARNVGVGPALGLRLQLAEMIDYRQHLLEPTSPLPLALGVGERAVFEMTGLVADDVRHASDHLREG